ncbi:MAG: VOC family protein [Pyrinomonadaceae bacterium]
MKIHRICPIFTVTNLEKALEFYCTIFGFEKEFEYAAGEGGLSPHSLKRSGLTRNREDDLRIFQQFA